MGGVMPQDRPLSLAAQLGREKGQAAAKAKRAAAKAERPAAATPLIEKGLTPTCHDSAAKWLSQEFNRPTKDIDLIAEAAFRRGYQQGAYAVIYQMEAGVPKYGVDDWFRRVTDWRFFRRLQQSGWKAGASNPRRWPPDFVKNAADDYGRTDRSLI
jgi:hypothetical protein